VVAEGAVRDPERVAAHFAGRADVVYRSVTTLAEVRDATSSADALVVTLQRLDRERMSAMGERVKVIGRMGVGLDTLDLAAAEARGTAVLNEPAYGIVEVATHAIALLLALQRRLPAVDAFVRGGWNGAVPLSAVQPLDELAVGVIGCGRIGGEVVEKLLGLVGTVLVYDPHAQRIPAGARRVDDLPALLRESDAVTIHTPLDPSTEGLIGAGELALMRSGAILVNVSRGGQVDEDALADALNRGHLGGAGLDVFAEEPLPGNSPLLRCPNTIFSPHCASYSERSSWRLAAWTIEDVITWLETGTVTHGAVVVAGSR
jgi:D-3-phosphoglycerate dehydrogenase